MVFSAVLDISPVEVGVSDQTVSLCYQVHGEKGKFYNLVSDDCLSINAHVSQPIAGVNSHVMDKITIRAIGSNGACYNISIVRENCEVTVNHPIFINSRFEEEGITVFNDRMIARDPNVVHISVPNCGRALVDVMNITCSEYKIRTSLAAMEVLELTTTRGISPIEAAQGLVGKLHLWKCDYHISLLLPTSLSLPPSLPLRPILGQIHAGSVTGPSSPTPPAIRQGHDDLPPDNSQEIQWIHQKELVSLCYLLPRRRQAGVSCHPGGICAV